MIEFQETTDSGVFNLAFGDKTHSGDIYDLSVSSNGDTEKILSTVGAALYSFSENYPGVIVYVSGNTKARTRLYRMGISKFIDQIKQGFYLYGQSGNDFILFKIGVDYDGFLAHRKFV